MKQCDVQTEHCLQMVQLQFSDTTVWTCPTIYKTNTLRMCEELFCKMYPYIYSQLKETKVLYFAKFHGGHLFLNDCTYLKISFVVMVLLCVDYW